MYVVPCVLFKKMYKNNKIMVKKINRKKLNKKQCSHDAWEQCFLLIFFIIINFYYYIFYVCFSLCVIEKKYIIIMK